MKNTIKVLGIIAIVAVIGFSMTACGGGGGGGDDDDTPTVRFPIDIAAIQGVVMPEGGGTPVIAITENNQYSGTVTWSPNHSTFAVSEVYTATITLTAKDTHPMRYTLEGVSANFFTVEGAATVSNSANSGVITAVSGAHFEKNGAFYPIFDKKAPLWGWEIPMMELKSQTLELINSNV